MTFISRKIAALIVSSVVITPVFADGHSAGDPTKGKKVFKKCASCHDVSEKEKIKVGPPLLNIVGRKIASFEGYKYSSGFTALGAKDEAWTEEMLMKYLKNPKKYVRKQLDDKKAKTKMVLKLKKDKDRANVIAYLKSLSKPAE